MKFTVYMPLGSVAPAGEFQTLEAVAEIARTLEEIGSDGGHVSEHPAPMADWLHNDPAGHDCIDPFVGLAFAAAATTRLMIHTSIVVLPYRNPFITAKSAATLQVLSNNRLILGVGVGYQKGEFDALGVSFSERGALTNEAIETMRLAWAGGPVVTQGRHFNAVGNEPRPAPSVPPPIWIGGGSAAAAERAARLGDGWVPFFSPPTTYPGIRESAIASLEDFARKADHVREVRAKLGKPDAFDICSGVTSPIRNFTTEEADKFCDEVNELEKIGVTWARASLPAPNRAAWIDNARWFGENVIKRYR
jgi:probable F420-dependent oxidoreductase